MVLKIERDLNRFQEIIKGRIKRNLKKYVSKGEMVGKVGHDVVTIPLPKIEVPQFRYGLQQTGGVGQGQGDSGTPIGASGEEGPGAGEAGNMPGQHALEVDVTLEELAEMLGEELELPRIQPKGSSRILAERNQYSSIYRAGPDSLVHFKRTYKEALKRQLSSGEYNPDDPIVVPIKRDKRYRAAKKTERPQNNAVILYMMDVSGSMGDEQKEIVRITSFWIDTWLRSQYDGIETRYIIHDAAAKEVDRETFYHTRESGGTLISSAYKLCHQIIETDYPVSEWNIYPFHFSDGDNWSGED
ncbi:MAG TPA: DUF444 family protein, partial [Bdellovibrionota bacterium]|nr:DUF444 family protein [Bdellovibrionota bacterium]